MEAVRLIDAFAERLAARGALYDLDGDTYFARCADPEFGALSGPDSAPGLSVEQMTALSAERGGDPDRPGKKDPLDPLVWRAERPGEPAWDSRFGPGRPGWHVECAAIAVEYLGPAFDVQAGGSDLVFPHHEMSASHARVACAGRRAASSPGYTRTPAWSPTRAQKMSKSLGNLVFVCSCATSGTDPMAIRLALLAHHYRSDWEWTDEVLRRRRTASTAGGPPSRRPRPGSERRPGRRPGRPRRTFSRRSASGWPTTWTPRARSTAIDAWADAALAAPDRSPRRRPPHPRHSRRPPRHSPVAL